MKMQNTFNVLIADSSENFLHISKRELQERNLKVIRAVNNNDLTNHISNMEFNLVFICIDTDKFSDEKVINIIRSSEKNHDTPIITALNSLTDTKLVENLYKAGVNDIIFASGSNIHFVEKIKSFQQLSLKIDAFNQENQQLREDIIELKSKNYKLNKRTIQDKKIFQKAVEQSPLMISVVNAKTMKTEFVNSMYREKLGFSLSDIKDCNILLNTSDKKSISIAKSIKDEILGGKEWKGKLYSRKKNGELFWQRSSIYPLFEDDIVAYVIIISEDISDEIKVAEELRINKENWEHINKNITSGITILKKDGGVLYANKKVSEIIGYSISELTNFSIKDVLHANHYNDTKRRLTSRLKGLNLENVYETRIITKRGETKIIETFGAKTKWMGELVNLVVINDITKKKHFSGLLSIQNNIDYLSSISIGLNPSIKQILKTLSEFEWVDGSGVYLLDKKKDGLKLVCHKGLSAKFVNEIQFVPQESDKFKLIQKKKSTYVKGVSSSSVISETVDKEGFKEILIIPLISNNNIVGALNLVSNTEVGLTENEKMIFESIGTRISQMITLINTQEELKVKNQKLQKTLKKIQEKQQLLVQKSKLESLGEMAAGVAHEINQPLSVIFLSLENILFKISGKKVSQEYLDKKLNSIANNIKRIKEIIDHIRTFSRDQKSLIIERVDVNEVIGKACAMINEQYNYHNILISLNLEEDIGNTHGNSHKLEQVMYNLLSNAKFALEEKESLPIDGLFDKEIHIRTYSNDNKIFIDVKDNGTGIEKDNLDNIFNPFFTTKPEGAGTGLGLSIVYGIITEMNGAINIESKRGEYTLIRIELPKWELLTKP